MTWKKAAAAVLLASAMAVTGVAQEDAKKIELVMVIGCLAKGSGDNVWMLEKGTAATATRAAFTTTDELAESQKKPLGSTQYRLLGVSEFGPEPHLGHRIQVKGLLIASGQDQRINVTSLQHVAPACQ